MLARLSSVLVLPALFVALPMACSSKPDLAPILAYGPAGLPPPGGAVQGVATGSGGLAITDGGACALHLPTTAITQQQVAASTPAVTGGTIAAGVYVLTAMNKYTGAGGATGPTAKVQGEVIQVDSTTYQHAKASGLADGGLASPSLESGNYTAASNTFTESATCGIGNIPVSYTVDSLGELKLSFLNEEYVFTRQ